jgi:hypothetical protein
VTELSFSSDELSDLLDWASDSVKPDRNQIDNAIDQMLFRGQQRQQQQPNSNEHRNQIDYAIDQMLFRGQQQQKRQHEHQITRSTVSRVALVFTHRFFGEIHDILCVKKKLSEAVHIGGTDPRAITTAIAAGLAASMGLSGAISISVATFVLLVISRAGLNAFCVATKGEILDEMSKADEALKGSRKRASTGGRGHA